MKLTAPLHRRIGMVVTRGVVELVNNQLKCQGLQLAIMADEVSDDKLEHFEHYGFTSVPFVGAEAVVLSPGGDRANAIAVCVTDRRHRPTDLAEGEVAIYTDEGKQVHCKRGGQVHVGTGADDFAARATPTQGDLDSIAQQINALRTAINGWTPTAGDGGAALKTSLSAWLALTLNMTPVAASKVKVK